MNQTPIVGPTHDRIRKFARRWCQESGSDAVRFFAIGVISNASSLYLVRATFGQFWTRPKYLSRHQDSTSPTSKSN